MAAAAAAATRRVCMCAAAGRAALSAAAPAAPWCGWSRPVRRASARPSAPLDRYPTPTPLACVRPLRPLRPLRPRGAACAALIAGALLTMRPPPLYLTPVPTRMRRAPLSFASAQPPRRPRTSLREPLCWGHCPKGRAPATGAPGAAAPRPLRRCGAAGRLSLAPDLIMFGGQPKIAPPPSPGSQDVMSRDA
ncbi:MAG: hypothetical protein J3K34DRAFT_429409 [Monoraphidium minutum]|nr:MAG: hypothetical protein J3K34DRAFT_429409 [Monoraphidium minutum]